MKKITFFLLCCAALGVYGIWYGVMRTTSATAVRVEIPPGANVHTVAAILAREGVVQSAWLYRLYVRLAQPALPKAGAYDIPAGARIPFVAQMLGRGDAVRRDVRVTFPEGWTLKQMADRLTARGFDGDAFLRVTRRPPAVLREDFALLRDLPKDASLEGYLFPETYDFAPEAAAEDIVRRMLAQMDRVFTPAMRTAARAHGLSVHEALTLASIVEREVHKEDERPIVSGIFYNRLRDGIALGSDATLDYIFGTPKIKHTLEETRVESPYNTYKYTGLPPGPIGAPSLSSLRAVAYPQKTAYYYFLNNAKTGETVFAKTLDEHVRNKAANGL